MGKDNLFNNGKPQWALENHKMQRVILSDEDAPLCWFACAPILDVCGLIPRVSGVPVGSTPLPESEKAQFLAQWEGSWKVVPFPPMGVTDNKRFYIQYTEAYLEGDTLILSGGTHEETQKITGNISTGLVTGNSINMQHKVVVPNEGQTNKFLFFRAPDGTIYVDNLGTHVMKNEPGKLQLMTAMGWPMTFIRTVPPTNQSMERNI